MEQLANKVRLILDVPTDWVTVVNDQEDGLVVAVALNMTAEDVGGPESGPRMSVYPTRFMHVGMDDETRWFVRLYDLTDDEDGFGRHEPSADIALGNDPGDILPRLCALILHDERFVLDREVH